MLTKTDASIVLIVPTQSYKNSQSLFGCNICMLCIDVICRAAAGGGGGGASNTSTQAQSTGVFCYSCQQEIAPGKFVRCLERKYHSACLRCYSCKALLGASAEIYKKDNEPHCSACGKFKD